MCHCGQVGADLPGPHFIENGEKLIDIAVVYRDPTQSMQDVV